MSKRNLNVKRFHICTWDLQKNDAFIEFGIEFLLNEENGEDLSFYLYLPFLQSDNKISDLSKNLSNDSNCRFIFNERVSSLESINSDSRDGCIIKFEGSRDSLTILPLKAEKLLNEKILKLSMNIPPEHKDKHFYVRVLIETKVKTLAIVKKEITKESFLYDVKINEQRNVPDGLHRYYKDNKLKLCQIEKAFCFHVIPDNYSISFIDDNKLKNVRKLEINAFHKYLPDITELKNDKYIILFNKSEKNSSHSFFSVFTQEIITLKQLSLAIIVNIVCSLLFALGSLHIDNQGKKMFAYSGMTWEYRVAIITLIIMLLYYIFKMVKKTTFGYK
jgi:hypothetical protein